MDRINVRVDEQLKHLLGAEAKSRGISPSDLVRQVLEEHLRASGRPGNCLELAQRLNLVGCYRGLPPDLSTGARHLHGFGRE